MAQNHEDQAAAPVAATHRPASGRRKIWLGILGAVFLAAVAGYGAYWASVLRYRESTDDAYVNGNVVQITPQISGTVVAIDADDTNFVKAGQALVRLDRADAEVALEEADAQLAKTVREVRNLFATSAQLEANVELRKTELERATEDLTRRERLASSGAISREEVQHARDTQRSAQAALAATEHELAATRARVDHTTVADHPDVRNAAAHVHDAYLEYSRTTLPAPVSGFVAKRSVQLGQRVGPGTPLMAVVPLDQVWVDANFKERELANMRVGQPVELTADLYGGKVIYHGQVVGFGAGTGSAFAVLPAQNATGNWIKIVQRVPVRIAIDPKALAGHPLQVGLSMQVEVDTHDRSGQRLPEVAQSLRAYATTVFDVADKAAAERVNAIIAANASAGASRATSRASHPEVAADRMVQVGRQGAALSPATRIR